MALKYEIETQLGQSEVMVSVANPIGRVPRAAKLPIEEALYAVAIALTQTHL